MANLLWVVLSMAILVMLVQVDCNCVTPLTSSVVSAGSCDVYLEDPTTSNRRLCGFMDGAAAERACHDLGKGVSTTANGNARQFRCVPLTGGGLDTLDGTMYTHVTGAQVGFGCSASNPAEDCFFGCYTSGGAVEGAPGTCSGAITDMAVGCQDINECVDGAYINCDGPYDEDCDHVPACAPEAVCTNLDGATVAAGARGWTCVCPGANAGEEKWNAAGNDPYDLDVGCIDVDECAVGGVCTNDLGIPSRCQNTPGSYTCICDAGHWVDETEECVVTNCDEYELRNIEFSNGWEGDMSTDIDDYEDVLTSTCETGYEPRASDTIRTTCRYDGTWCQCDSVECKRKKCDVPYMDGNAETIQLDGETDDSIEYHCLDGYRSLSGEYYESDCDDEGMWDNPTKLTDERCKDVDECEYKDTCPEHSDCVNTIGSYHCVCHHGFSGATCMDRISCGNIPEVEHAERLTHTSATVGRYEMVVNYRCDEGYHVSTEITHYKKDKEFDITCKVTECWSPDPIPECVPISCGDPGIIKHASREGNSFYYDSEVTYTCYNGFRRADYEVHSSHYAVSFEITCEEKGWTKKQHCVDIDECTELTQPCGHGLGHYCVNTEGAFTCSCAYGYRLDSSGHRCIALHIEEHEEPPQDPCYVYQAYGLCNDGTCHFDSYGIPECRCDPGYIGAFCDRPDEFDYTIAFIISIVGIVIGGLALIMALVLACCVLTRHCDPIDDDTDSVAYGHHVPKLKHKSLGLFKGVPFLDY